MLSKAEIKRVRSLHLKKHRAERGFFLVEGPKSVGELLSSSLSVESLYATSDWLAGHRDLRPAFRVHEVSPAEMQRISSLPSPQGVLAVAAVPQDPLDPGSLDCGWTLALDDVQDPGNVGTLVRIADWYGFERVLCSRGCADPFHPKVIAASMGSFCRVALHQVELSEALANLRLPVLGCDLKGSDVHQLPPLEGGVVVIGSEARGLSPEVRARVSQFITIPRIGRAESLNAAVAAGIICDNLMRRRPAQRTTR